MEQTHWKHCSTCKGDIEFDQIYWVCNVSTCNRKASSYIFCSVSCWQEHVPLLRHRDSWAEEQRSPSVGAWRQANAVQGARSGGSTERRSGTRPDRHAVPESRVSTTADMQRTPRRIVVGASDHRAGAGPSDEEVPQDILIVASKLKKYIRARHGMSTSDSVMEELSERVRALCDDAVARAGQAGRRTVMDRDF